MHATSSGMPAAYLTTPAGKNSVPLLSLPLTGIFLDVVKTRLQVEARQGQTHYKGLTDAFVKICMSQYHWSFV